MTPAVLADLDPLISWNSEAAFKILSQRYQGSFRLLLQRASRSPSTSRAYLPGDPVQLIDWKAYARNDQLSVREERDEAAVKVAIFLDPSPTLHWPENPSRRGGDISKWEQACRIALHLAYHHVQCGDQVRLMLLGEQVGEPASEEIVIRSTAAVSELFAALLKSDFGPDLLAEFLRPTTQTNANYGMGYLISDFLSIDLVAELPISSAKLPRMIQVLSSRELRLDWLDTAVCYFDESLTKKEFLGSRLQDSKDYQQTLEGFFARLDQFARANGFDYFRVTEQTQVVTYLNALVTGLEKGVSS